MILHCLNRSLLTCYCLFVAFLAGFVGLTSLCTAEALITALMLLKIAKEP